MKYLEILRAKLAELTTTRDAAIAEAEAIADLIGDETDTEKRDAAIADGDAALERAKTLTDEIKLVEERIGELEALRVCPGEEDRVLAVNVRGRDNRTETGARLRPIR